MQKWTCFEENCIDHNNMHDNDVGLSECLQIASRRYFRVETGGLLCGCCRSQEAGI
jgi:hypothetical protein